MIQISVIVPVYNNAKTLDKCLRALSQQSLPRDQYEVIVIDGDSNDRSAEIAQTWPVRLLNIAERSAAIKRNTGAKFAQGNWLAFTDADCIPSRNWLKFLWGSVNGLDVWGAAGKTLGYESRSDAARFVDLTGGLDAGTYLTHPHYPWAPTCNMLIQQQLFQNLNGFDERYFNFEYCDFHLRARACTSSKFLYEPRAVVLHHHRSSWREYWRQQFFYGHGYGQFMWKYRDRFHWNVWRELKAWGHLLRLSIDALRPGHDDRSLVRRGMLVKQLAQRLGFDRTYYNQSERAKW